MSLVAAALPYRILAAAGKYTVFAHLLPILTNSPYVKYTLRKVNFTFRLAGTDLKTRIREKRTAWNMTQEELAARLHVSRQTVISLENNKYKPSLVLAHKLAQIFECQMEDIFIFEGDENIE